VENEEVNSIYYGTIRPVNEYNSNEGTSRATRVPDGEYCSAENMIILN